MSKFWDTLYLSGKKTKNGLQQLLKLIIWLYIYILYGVYRIFNLKYIWQITLWIEQLYINSVYIIWLINATYILHSGLKSKKSAIFAKSQCLPQDLKLRFFWHFRGLWIGVKKYFVKCWICTFFHFSPLCKCYAIL